jgi:ribosome-binding factor A
VLRSAVGKATGIKFTPTLTFIADALPDNARHLEEALAAAREADAQLAAVRQGAQPAGEPDPYRKPRDEDGDDL